jgi:predicted nucleic acid-binding protein
VSEVTVAITRLQPFNFPLWCQIGTTRNGNLRRPAHYARADLYRRLGRTAEAHKFVWLVSDEILLEYKRVLGRLGVRRPLIGKIINLLREEAELVPTSALPSISPDPGDDPFCGCAEAGRADFILTLNPKDFPQPLLSAHVIKPGEDLPTTARRKPRLRV